MQSEQGEFTLSPLQYYILGLKQYKELQESKITIAFMLKMVESDFKQQNLWGVALSGSAE